MWHRSIYIKEEKIPTQTDEPGEEWRGQSSGAGARALTWGPALGVFDWLTEFIPTGRLPWKPEAGSPAAQVDNRDPLKLFLNLLLLFVHPQVNSPLETGLAPPTLTLPISAVTPPTAQREWDASVCFLINWGRTVSTNQIAYHARITVEGLKSTCKIISIREQRIYK